MPRTGQPSRRIAVAVHTPADDGAVLLDDASHARLLEVMQKPSNPYHPLFARQLMAMFDAIEGAQEERVAWTFTAFDDTGAVKLEILRTVLAYVRGLAARLEARVEEALERRAVAVETTPPCGATFVTQWGGEVATCRQRVGHEKRLGPEATHVDPYFRGGAGFYWNEKEPES